jgi:hypothetical protein
MDYGEVIRKAWDITKKYKYLWIFGFILALFGGRGVGVRTGGGRGIEYTLRGEDLQKAPLIMQQFLFRLQNVLRDNIHLIILSVIFLIIFSLAGLVLFIIAEGGLIGCVSNIESNEKSGLIDGFKIGAHYFWRILGKNLLIYLSLFIIILFFVLLFTIPFYTLYSSSNYRFLWFTIPLFIIFIIFMIPIGVFITILNDYSSRFLVIKNNGIIRSIKNSFRLIFNNFKHTIIIALILFGIGILIGIILFIIFLIIGGPAALLGFSLYRAGAIAPLLIIAIIAVLFLLVLSVIINGTKMTFTSSVWTLTFFKLIEDFQEKPVL